MSNTEVPQNKFQETPTKVPNEPSMPAPVDLTALVKSLQEQVDAVDSKVVKMWRVMQKFFASEIK